MLLIQSMLALCQSLAFKNGGFLVGYIEDTMNKTWAVILSFPGLKTPGSRTYFGDVICIPSKVVDRIFVYIQNTHMPQCLLHAIPCMCLHMCCRAYYEAGDRSPRWQLVHDFYVGLCLAEIDRHVALYTDPLIAFTYSVMATRPQKNKKRKIDSVVDDVARVRSEAHKLNGQPYSKEVQDRLHVIALLDTDYYAKVVELLDKNPEFRQFAHLLATKHGSSRPSTVKSVNDYLFYYACNAGYERNFGQKVYDEMRGKTEEQIQASTVIHNQRKKKTLIDILRLPPITTLYQLRSLEVKGVGIGAKACIAKDWFNSYNEFESSDRGVLGGLKFLYKLDRNPTPAQARRIALPWIYGGYASVAGGLLLHIYHACYDSQPFDAPLFSIGTPFGSFPVYRLE